MVAQQEMERLIAQQGATVSVVAYDLETGNELLIQPDLSYHPASPLIFLTKSS